jgi:type II secretory pathway component PulM
MADAERERAALAAEGAQRCAVYDELLRPAIERRSQQALADIERERATLAAECARLATECGAAFQSTPPHDRRGTPISM